MVGQGRGRRSDPRTSDEAVRRLTNDLSMYEKVLRAAYHSYRQGSKGFTDDYLARATRIPRHVVARVRLECERDGWLERGETVRREDGLEVLTFRMRPGHAGVMSMFGSIEKEEGRG